MKHFPGVPWVDFLAVRCSFASASRWNKVDRPANIALEPSAPMRSSAPRLILETFSPTTKIWTMLEFEHAGALTLLRNRHSDVRRSRW
jgi:hypothetical protein